jgi:hypothetical protein
MSIEQGLFQLIQTDATVSSLVNMAQGKGLYWILAPKGSVYPQIVLSRVATSDVYTFKGATGFRNALFQVDCYASLYYPSRAIADAVRGLLQSYVGTLADTDLTSVAAVLTTKDWDMPYEEGATGFVFRSMLEFRVWYSEVGVIDGGTFGSMDTLLIDGGSFSSSDAGRIDGGSF